MMRLVKGLKMNKRNKNAWHDRGKNKTLTIRTQTAKVVHMPERPNFRVVVIHGNGQNEEVWRFHTQATGLLPDELPLQFARLFDHDTVKDSIVEFGWTTTIGGTTLNFLDLPKSPDHIYMFILSSAHAMKPSLGWECTQNKLSKHTKLDMDSSRDENMVESIAFETKSVVALVGSELDVGDRTPEE